MLFTTTQEHEELRRKIREFAEGEIKPQAFLLDQNNEFPAEAVEKLGKMGLMGIPYPKEYGGAGMDILSYAIAVEELSRVDGGARCNSFRPCIAWILADICVRNRRAETEIPGSAGER